MEPTEQIMKVIHPKETAEVIRTISLSRVVLDRVCNIQVTIREVFELATMTSISDISIDSIIDEVGQTITSNMIDDNQKTDILLWIRTKLLST